MATTLQAPKGVPKVVAILAGLLDRAAERGDGEAAADRPVHPGTKNSPFHGPTKPAITVKQYADRIFRYAGCSPACFVVAYVYLDRLVWRPERPAVAVDSYSVHRLLITSVMVAAKFMDDIHYNNAYFAKVGGIEVTEMNSLELEFLFGLQFELNVSPVLFNSYCSILEGEMCLEVSSPIEYHGSFLPEEEHENQKATSSLFTQRVVEITQ